MNEDMKNEHDFSKTERGRFFHKGAILTVNFDATVRERATRDPDFRAALFREGVASLLAGDWDTARAGLHAYIKATIGYAALSKATGIPPKSLMRMFGPSGNPTAANLFAVIRVLQKKTRVHIEVRASAA
jgi:DNA-binding phage protein